MTKIINCRLCLHSFSKANTSLTEDITVQGTNVCISAALSEMFPSLTKLQLVQPDDSCLPGNVCNICLRYLDISYRFWKQCEKVNSTIVNLIEEHRKKKSEGISEHAQHNLESCPYFERPKKKRKRRPQKVEGEKLFIFNETVNEVVIDNTNEDAESKELDSEENEKSKNAFLDYLGLELAHENSSNHMEMNWKEYVKSSSTILCESDLVCYKLEHDYCQEPRRYACGTCKKSFASESVLKLHSETYHSNTRHDCRKCGQKCLSPVDLMNHLHNDHPLYKCKICKKQYISHYKFEIHIKRNHNGYEPFQCSLCPKSFVRKSFLAKHEKINHFIPVRSSGKRKNCPFCKRIFASKGGLEWHVEVKHGPQMIHECDICLSTFSNSGTLIKHMKRHVGFKPIICMLCDKACPSMIHLQEHMKFKHQSHATYVCELCDETCLKESDLIAHIETHIAET